MDLNFSYVLLLVWNGKIEYNIFFMEEIGLYFFCKDSRVEVFSNVWVYESFIYYCRVYLNFNSYWGIIGWYWC